MNYIGSKFSLLPFLDECISEIVGNDNTNNKVFCDLFSGTATVGKFFKKKKRYFRKSLILILLFYIDFIILY